MADIKLIYKAICDISLFNLKLVNNTFITVAAIKFNVFYIFAKLEMINWKIYQYS